MEYIKSLNKRYGVDVGWHKSNIHPKNGEGCVGKQGIDKNYNLQQVLELAYKMEEKPNIIIRSGPKAKWYFKKVPSEDVESRISQYMEKNEWNNSVSRCIMYIIEWE